MLQALWLQRCLLELCENLWCMKKRTVTAPHNFFFFFFKFPQRWNTYSVFAKKKSRFLLNNKKKLNLNRYFICELLIYSLPTERPPTLPSFHDYAHLLPFSYYRLTEQIITLMYLQLLMAGSYFYRRKKS